MLVADGPEALRTIERLASSQIDALWLPGDAEDKPPVPRPLREYLIEQMKPVIAWASAHGSRDASQLNEGFFRLGGAAKKGESLTLGKVLSNYQVGSVEMLRKCLDDPER